MDQSLDKFSVRAMIEIQLVFFNSLFCRFEITSQSLNCLHFSCWFSGIRNNDYDSLEC